MKNLDLEAQGKIGGQRAQAKRFEDYPLTLEQAAHYVKLPISLLRQGMAGQLINGTEPPKVWKMVGRTPYFQVTELDHFIAARQKHN